MSDYGPTQSAEPRGSVAGGYVFAGVIMIIIGSFQAIAGLVGILENEFYVVSPNNVFELDATAWGWIHLTLGLLVAYAGYALFAARTWARVIGVTLAALSAIANFFFIPYYPFWAILDHSLGRLGDLGADAVRCVGGGTGGLGASLSGSTGRKGGPNSRISYVPAGASAAASDCSPIATRSVG